MSDKLSITLLSPQKEDYCRLLIERGYTQLAAYDIAFPENIEGAWETRKKRASELARAPEVKQRMMELRHAESSDFIMRKNEKLLKLAGIADADISLILDDRGMIDPTKVHLLPKGAIAKLKTTSDEKGYSSEVTLRDPLAAMKIDNEMQGHVAADVQKTAGSLAAILAGMNNTGKQLPSESEKPVDIDSETVHKLGEHERT